MPPKEPSKRIIKQKESRFADLLTRIQTRTTFDSTHTAKLELRELVLKVKKGTIEIDDFLELQRNMPELRRAYKLGGLTLDDYLNILFILAEHSIRLSLLSDSKQYFDEIARTIEDSLCDYHNQLKYYNLKLSLILLGLKIGLITEPIEIYSDVRHNFLQNDLVSEVISNFVNDIRNEPKDRQLEYLRNFEEFVNNIDETISVKTLSLYPIITAYAKLKDYNMANRILFRLKRKAQSFAGKGNYITSSNLQINIIRLELKLLQEASNEYNIKQVKEQITKIEETITDIKFSIIHLPKSEAKTNKETELNEVIAILRKYKILAKNLEYEIN